MMYLQVCATMDKDHSYNNPIIDEQKRIDKLARTVQDWVEKCLTTPGALKYD